MGSACQEQTSRYDLPPDVVAEARRRAQVTLATALLLLREPTGDLDPQNVHLAEDEAARVLKSEGLYLPAWLGPPGPDFLALDYGRFRPLGVYSRSSELEEYFRAVSWLQAVPFRLESDPELLAWIMLVQSLQGLARGDEQFLEDFGTLTGQPDDPWIGNSGGSWYSHVNATTLDDDRQKDLEPPRISDLPALPRRPGEPLPIRFRILSAARLPDASLFQDLLDANPPARPSGLHVAAVLGSKDAAELLRLQGDDLAAVERARPLFEKPGLYGEILPCLGALLDPVEPEAPSVFHSAQWRRKSMQTALAGWAQLRHAWVLHTKITVDYLGGTLTDPGFVEPDPEFFARLGQLARSSRERFERMGVFPSPSEAGARDLRHLADQLAGGAASAEALGTLYYWGVLFPELGVDHWGDRDGLVRNLRLRADQVARGEGADLEAVRELMQHHAMDLRQSWLDLEFLCFRLEAMAHKQLRGVEWNQDDRKLLTGYGAALARCMLYGGNSYLTPLDDAPRIVDVASFPASGTVLNVGIGRPRPLFVLYEWKGRQVLCQGGILPYAEFEGERLTDPEWRALLDSAPPRQPSWLSTLQSPHVEPVGKE